MRVEYDFWLANRYDKEQIATGRKYAFELVYCLEIAVGVHGIAITAQADVFYRMHA